VAARSVIVRLEAEVAGYIAGMGRAGRATQDTARQVVQARRSISDNTDAMETAGKALTIFGAASLAGLGASAKAAMDWESAWAGVTKTVNGTPEQMNELEDSLRGLAKTLPSTHEEIAGVAEAAGQLGVAREDVVGFTKTMIDLGVSTNLTAEDAATNIAQISNVMGTMAREGSEGVSRFGAALVALGNDGASTEAEILSMAQRIAGAAATVGATETDVLALANTLASMGVKAELGGGVTTRVLLKMYAAVKDGGDKLDAFAKTAGLSAAEFSKAFGESPVRAMDLVNKGLSRIKDEGGNVVSTMKDMGIKGTEELQVMLALAASGDLLSDSLDLGSKAWRENTALVQEATKRYETTDSKVKIAWNNIKDAAIDAGAVLLPIIQSVAESVAGLAQVFGDLPAPVQGTLTLMAGVVGAAALAGGGLLTLTVKVAETRAAFAALNTAGSRIPAMFQKIAKGAAIGAGFAIVGVALAKIAEGDMLSKIDTGMGKVNLQLQKAASTAPDANKALDALFQDRDGGGLGDSIEQINDLDGALKRTFRKDGGQAFNDWASNLVGGMTGIKGNTQVLADSFDRLDQGLADMVGSGNAEGAAEGFAKVQAAAKDQGIGIDELLTKFPSYADALKQAEADANAAGEGGDKAAGGIKAAGDASSPAAVQAKEVADALAEVGVDASGAATDLVKFTDALLAAGLINLSARDAARNYQSAIDSMTDSIKENGTSMDITTEKGRANQAAFDAIAGAGMDVVKANAANGASQEELQGNLGQTYQDLLTAAGGLGITGQKAQDLARDVLHVPKGVSIDSWMSSAAKNMADQTLQAANNVDGKVVNVYVNTHATTFEQRVGLPGVMADGSRGQGLGVYAPRKAGGGDLDVAPGPKGVDSQLFFGAKGEHVLTAGEVDAMGGQQAVYKFRAQVRAGNVPALAGGGGIGHSTAARALVSSNPSRGGGAAAAGIDIAALAAAVGDRPIQNEIHLDGRKLYGWIKSAPSKYRDG